MGLLILLLGGVALGLAFACSSSFPRDQYFGTDAGTDFVPGMWDASVPVDGQAIDAPDDSVDQTD
jgi:hypothetical protein